MTWDFWKQAAETLTTRAEKLKAYLKAREAATAAKRTAIWTAARAEFVARETATAAKRRSGMMGGAWAALEASWAPSARGENMSEPIYDHAVIDLETLGTKADCVVVAIGAVLCAPYAGVQDAGFFVRLNIDEQLACGRKISEDTLCWWMKQDAQAREQFALPSVTVPTALRNLSEYLKRRGDQTKTLSVWGCGANFDNAILEHMYNQWHLPLPWEWWNSRCYRTLKSLFRDVPMELKPAVAHHAMHDAMAEARHLSQLLQKKAPAKRG